MPTTTVCSQGSKSESSEPKAGRRSSLSRDSLKSLTSSVWIWLVVARSYRPSSRGALHASKTLKKAKSLHRMPHPTLRHSRVRECQLVELLWLSPQDMTAKVLQHHELDLTLHLELQLPNRSNQLSRRGPPVAGKAQLSSQSLKSKSGRRKSKSSWPPKRRTWDTRCCPKKTKCELKVDRETSQTMLL